MSSGSPRSAGAQDHGEPSVIIVPLHGASPASTSRVFDPPLKPIHLPRRHRPTSHPPTSFIATRGAGTRTTLNLAYVLLGLSIIVSLFGMINTLVLSTF